MDTTKTCGQSRNQLPQLQSLLRKVLRKDDRILQASETMIHLTLLIERPRRQHLLPTVDCKSVASRIREAIHPFQTKEVKVEARWMG